MVNTRECIRREVESLESPLDRQEAGRPEHGAVLAGQHAPLSEAKAQAIEDSRSEGERLIARLADRLIDDASDKPEPKKIVLRLDKVREWLAMRKGALDSRQFGLDGRAYLETAEKISSILRAHGLWLSKQFKVAGERFRVVANFAIDDSSTWEEIKGHERQMPKDGPM